jgi:hypothetical protein
VIPRRRLEPGDLIGLALGAAGALILAVVLLGPAGAALLAFVVILAAASAR